MTALVRPGVARHRSWAAALAELRTEGEHVNGAGMWMLPPAERWDLTEAGCSRAAAVLLAALDDPPPEHADTASASARVPCEFSWIVDDKQADEPVVGFLALRTMLTAWLLDEGGHIGYSVVPSARRRGHAHRALGLAVRRAAGLGIERALVTCDEDNLASARTIESAGGVLEDVRHGKSRYWIDTGALGASSGAGT